MTITVLGYVPAWDLPDISPYVTKLVYYLTIAKVPFEWKAENLADLDKNAPFGKLPYILDDDNPGEKIADSNTIIEYIEKKTGKSLDEGLSASDKAVCLAFERLIGEHLYYSGVLEVRWRGMSPLRLIHRSSLKPTCFDLFQRILDGIRTSRMSSKGLR